MEPTDEEISDLIASLIEDGALEILGYDSISDSFTYKITDRCKEVYPELYYTHYEQINGIASDLWLAGIIDIVFKDGQTVVALTKEQLEYVRKNINTFPEEERLFLDSIISYYTNQNGV